MHQQPLQIVGHILRHSRMLVYSLPQKQIIHHCCVFGAIPVLLLVLAHHTSQAP